MKAKVVAPAALCKCGHCLEDHLETVEVEGLAQKVVTGACQSKYAIPGCFVNGEQLAYPCGCNGYHRPG